MIVRERGFSLAELLVVVAVSSVILYAFFIALRVGDEQFQTSQLNMTIQESTREGLYKMIQEIRQSSPNRVKIVPDPNPNILPGNDILRFCIPNPNRPVNNLCVQNCTQNVDGNNPCDFSSLNSCVQNCNASWDANWKTTCNIDCNIVCLAYCNADYKVNWKDSLRIQYARGGRNCGQVLRTTCVGDCPIFTCTDNDLRIPQTSVMANDVMDNRNSNPLGPGLNFEGNSSPNPTVVTATLRALRQLTNNRWARQRQLSDNRWVADPLEMNAQAEIRNS